MRAAAPGIALERPVQPSLPRSAAVRTRRCTARRARRGAGDHRTARSRVSRRSAAGSTSMPRPPPAQALLHSAWSRTQTTGAPVQAVAVGRHASRGAAAARRRQDVDLFVLSGRRGRTLAFGPGASRRLGATRRRRQQCALGAPRHAFPLPAARRTGSTRSWKAATATAATFACATYSSPTSARSAFRATRRCRRSRSSRAIHSTRWYRAARCAMWSSPRPKVAHGRRCDCAATPRARLGERDGESRKAQRAVVAGPSLPRRHRPRIGDGARRHDLAGGERRELRLRGEHVREVAQRERGAVEDVGADATVDHALCVRQRQLEERQRGGKRITTCIVERGSRPTTSAPCSPNAAVQSAAVNFQSGKWLCTISKPGATHSTQRGSSRASSVDRRRVRAGRTRLPARCAAERSPRAAASRVRRAPDEPCASTRAPTSAGTRRSAARSCGW